jgi:two-component system, NarL family, sensor kinase
MSFIKVLLLSVLTGLWLSSYGQINQVMQTLGHDLQLAKSDSDFINAYSNAVFALQARDVVLADSLVQIELKLGAKTSLMKYKAMTYNDYGTIKYRQGKLLESKELYLKALAIRQQLGDPADIGSSLMKLGVLYYELGDNAKALDNFLNTAKIFERLNKPTYVAYCYGNIALVFYRAKDIPQYRKYVALSLAINIKQKDSIGIANSYMAMAHSMDAVSEVDSAFIIYTLADNIYDKLGYKLAKPDILNNMAGIFKQKGDSIKAITYYLQAIQVAKKLGVKNEASIFSKNLGELYVQMGRMNEAQPYLLEAYQAAKKGKELPTLAYSAKNLALIASSNKDFAQAYQYQNEYIEATDSVYSIESAKQIADMQTKYETDKKEQLIQIQQLQINKRNIILIVTGLLVALSLLVGWLWYNRNQLQQKAAIQAEALLQQNLRAKAVLDAEEHERQRIGRDLHDGIGQVLSAAKMQLSALQTTQYTADPIVKDKLQNALDLVDESVKEVRSISHNMMPNMLIKAGLVSAVREFVSRMNGDTIKIDLDIVGLDDRLDHTVESVLYRVLQEIMSNIIRHADASQVTIQLLRHPHELMLMVEDNGKGFDVNQIMLQDEGIGLKNITTRIAYLHGQVHYDSMPSKGTTVTIEIPI